MAASGCVALCGASRDTQNAATLLTREAHYTTLSSLVFRINVWLGTFFTVNIGTVVCGGRWWLVRVAHNIYLHHHHHLASQTHRTAPRGGGGVGGLDTHWTTTTITLQA